MAYNPFASPTLSGYNASPPPDDGSAAEANRVTWAKSKTKLGDPLKTYADAIKAAVSTAFGSRLLNAVNEQTSTYTVQTSDAGKVVKCTGTFTVTLPALATVDTGWPVVIWNAGTGTITVDGDGSETINGATTQTLISGQSAIFMSDSSDWSMILKQERPTFETAQTLTGAGEFTWTSIPAGVNEIRFAAAGFSHNDGSNQAFGIQLGDSGGLETTGYACAIESTGPTVTTATTYFPVTTTVTASFAGSAKGSLQRITGNQWIWECVSTDAASAIFHATGSKTLSAELDRVGFVLTGGSMDGGTANIVYQ
jgi:hypothetical protein